MQKNITKSFIFLLFALMVFSSGCSRKREAIVLSEPERIASEEAAVQAGSSENAKAPGEAESSVKAEHSGEADARTDSEKTQVIDSEQAIPDTIMVHVCGAVLCEGVYELPTGSRV